MNKIEDKALSICREYDELMSKVSKLTNGSKDSLMACPRSNDPNAKTTVKRLPYTHLSEAFEIQYDEDNEGAILSEKRKAEILKDCPACSKAYVLVKERKAAKKRLGAVKRAIRLIGRSNHV